MAIRVEESPPRGITQALEPLHSNSKPRLWHKFHKFFGKDANSCLTPSAIPDPEPATRDAQENQQQVGLRRDNARKVGIGLPRQATFSRQISEKRDNLAPVTPCPSERRAVSAQRQQRAVSAYRARSKSSPSPQLPTRVTSAPVLPPCNGSSHHLADRAHAEPPPGASSQQRNLEPSRGDESAAPFGQTPSEPSSEEFDALARDEETQMNLELDSTWILNLSMHFRDRSDREKFFITFVEKSNRWRRVTISCDYRNAEADSLETDLKELARQRDKHAQVYQSIRDSLPTIQFYRTVTNLKLQTESGRLHVHVTEDVNEIIPYPPASSVKHVMSDQANPVREAREGDINFVSHLSGFVYKVSFQGREYIQKEIPGPDAVDEFLYEINALHALAASTCVIHLEAIVFDKSRQTVKGLLIPYAERGAVVDLLYDHPHDLPLSDRLRWARQAIQGLSDIHEEGYVQGDFTLSNIVIDRNHDARIIDINRRGCPVGWEPPELAQKIGSNQKISMYIGQKSDLFQLGMTLWALAMQEDEPERHDHPLSMTAMSDEVPEWFRQVVDVCLSPQPRDRWSAQQLLRLFPAASSDQTAGQPSRVNRVQAVQPTAHRFKSDGAVGTEDLERLGRPRRRSTSEAPSTGGASFVEPVSSSYQFDSGSSYVDIVRGRRPRSRSGDPGNGESADRWSEDRPSEAWDEPDFAPQIISRSPKAVLRREKSDQHDAQYPEPQYPTPPAPSAPPAVGLCGHLPASDDQRSIAGAISDHQSQASELELPGPSPMPSEPATPSLTSNSTPRNPASEPFPSALSLSSQPALDLVTGDLRGFGGHPSLEEYSPHEPRKAPDSYASQSYDTRAEWHNPPDPTDYASPAIETLSSTNTRSSGQDAGVNGGEDVAKASEPAPSLDLSEKPPVEEKQLLLIPS